MDSGQWTVDSGQWTDKYIAIVLSVSVYRYTSYLYTSYTIHVYIQWLLLRHWMLLLGPFYQYCLIYSRCLEHQSTQIYCWSDIVGLV